jgi:hypothetical protein
LISFHRLLHRQISEGPPHCSSVFSLIRRAAPAVCHDGVRIDGLVEVVAVHIEPVGCQMIISLEVILKTPDTSAGTKRLYRLVASGQKSRIRG